MIKVFGQTDKIFTTNGDVVLHPLRAKVHKEDNGDFYLDIETDLSYIDSLVSGNIIVANTPQGDQAFRISNASKTKNKINCNAWTNLPTDCKILVPSGSLSAYTSATNYPSSTTYTYVEYDPE